MGWNGGKGADRTNKLMIPYSVEASPATFISPLQCKLTPCRDCSAEWQVQLGFRAKTAQFSIVLSNLYEIINDDISSWGVKYDRALQA